ncbi:hypothetical protein DID76_03430 [Candidatus Marinamargulisbacteria bacterium SCGC AG-414-C22]|nr:hypothetical protein DID76_03430 [Candidatus Marinamargulisbacteria bacterium SCGC AG-414-C22]
MIGLSIKSKYGLAVVLELALAEKGCPIQIKKLASLRSVPKKYLEQILIDLKKQGILKSSRGSQGGYQLAMPATTLTICDIMDALEGKKALSDGYCGGSVLKKFWSSADKKCKEIFNVTIATLVKEKEYADQCLTFNI